MKAKEYYQQYGEAVAKEVMDGGDTSALTKLVHAMVDESLRIMEERKCVKEEAVMAVFKEQNQKWNAMVRMFEKDGFHDMKRDGFMNYIRMKVYDWKMPAPTASIID